MFRPRRRRLRALLSMAGNRIWIAERDEDGRQELSDWVEAYAYAYAAYILCGGKRRFRAEHDSALTYMVEAARALNMGNDVKQLWKKELSRDRG